MARGGVVNNITVVSSLTKRRYVMRNMSLAVGMIRILLRQTAIDNHINAFFTEDKKRKT